MPAPFLTAAWRNLAMINYEVEASVLQAYVPAGTALDSWQGRYFASLVGFQFLHTKVLGIPIPFYRNFEEINLRFYVRREVGEEVRRGVVFIRELVPRQAIALVARAMYNEPYRALPMRHTIALEPALSASYSWRLGGRWNRFAVAAQGRRRCRQWDHSRSSLRSTIGVTHDSATDRRSNIRLRIRSGRYLAAWRILMPISMLCMDLTSPRAFVCLYRVSLLRDRISP